MTGPLIVVAILIAATIADDVWLRWKKRRENRPLSLTHPSVSQFTRGDLPSHEDCPLTPTEEDTFRSMAGREHDWIRQAILGRQKGQPR